MSRSLRFRLLPICETSRERPAAALQMHMQMNRCQYRTSSRKRFDRTRGPMREQRVIAPVVGGAVAVVGAGEAADETTIVRARIAHSGGVSASPA
jgi:hypothetical protein